MRLVPYKNVFEIEIPNVEEYNQYQNEQREEFREELINEPNVARVLLNDNGVYENTRGPLFTYFTDVIGRINQSKYIGYPRFKVRKDIENELYVEPETNFLSSWETFHHHPSPETLDPAQFLLQKDGFQYNENDNVEYIYNSYGYVAFHSTEKYLEYEFDVKFTSTADDNDRFIMLLGLFVEPSGKEHTLSAIRNNDSPNFTWRVVYNYMQPDEWVVRDMSGRIQQASNWNLYPTGTRIKCVFNESDLYVYTTQHNSEEFVEDATIHITLNNDKRTLIFKNPRMIGLGCHSQAYTTFSDIKLIDYGVTYPNFLGKTVTLLLRGNNFTGRHIIPKYMAKLDINKLLVLDDNDRIIATVCPMFRTILIGYTISGIVNSGVDMISDLTGIEDIKNILDIIYKTKQFEQYNIILEGDVVQPFINHFYIRHLELKDEIGHTRDWIDLYVLPQNFIDRMNDRVSQYHFNIWGYAKEPYVLPNYPMNIDSALYQTCSLRDKEIWGHDLGDQPISKFPSTASIPRKNGNRLLIELISSSTVNNLVHYKTKPPFNCPVSTQSNDIITPTEYVNKTIPGSVSEAIDYQDEIIDVTTNELTPDNLVLNNGKPIVNDTINGGTNVETESTAPVSYRYVDFNTYIKIGILPLEIINKSVSVEDYSYIIKETEL